MNSINVLGAGTAWQGYINIRLNHEIATSFGKKLSDIVSFIWFHLIYVS